MRIHLSASRALSSKVKSSLGYEPPRMASADGKNIGTQSLHSDARDVYWQCQYVRAFYGARHGAVIAVEAFSRYTLLLPFNEPLTASRVEAALIQRWIEDWLHWRIATGMHAMTSNPVSHANLLCIDGAHWHTNTDLSINGHVADAEIWLRQDMADRRVSDLSEAHARELGLYLNQTERRAPKGQGSAGRFIPYQRLLTLSDAIEARSNRPTTASDAPTSNVIQLAKYRNRQPI